MDNREERPVQFGEWRQGDDGLVRRLELRPVAFHVALVVAAIAVIAILDAVAPAQLSFSAYYYATIIWAGWFTARRTSLFLTLLAWASWTAVALTIHSSGPNLMVSVFNPTVRLALFLIVWSMLSTIREIGAERRQLALLDPLTGVANLRVLYSSVEQEIERLRRYGRPFTLAYLDLDQFKSVNDTLGHGAGDLVLRGVADYLSSHVREVDTVARLGGDEFVVLMPETDEAGASTALKRLLDGLNAFISQLVPTVDGVGATIGASVFVRPPWSADHAVSLSDGLMYRAKKACRGTLALRAYNETSRPEVLGRPRQMTVRRTRSA